MRVDHLMTMPVCTCQATAPLAEAARVMWDEDCGSVPVVDEDGLLCGLVTDRDLCMAAYVTGGCLRDVQVRDVMSKKIYACLPSDDLSIPLEIMRRAQVRRVPVVDQERRPLGMVSIGDLARLASVPGTDDLAPDCGSVVGVLADICEPRSEAVASA